MSLALCKRVKPLQSLQDDIHLDFGFILVVGISAGEVPFQCLVDLGARHNKMGSLAGAARFRNDSGSVQSVAQLRQKRNVAQKGKSYIDFDFQYEYKL